MTGICQSATPVHREIERLLHAAGQYGEGDLYRGKRHAARVSGELQLEVTTDTADPSAAWPVGMHDISDEGVSFWSKRKVSERTLIYIREFSSDNLRVWIPACVKHSTMGIRGHLIGTSFDAGESCAPSRPYTGIGTPLCRGGHRPPAKRVNPCALPSSGSATRSTAPQMRRNGTSSGPGA